jgi:hypothetical protein
MHKAWNGWYHVNGNTYGTWLRGDQRGWRSRWHREHVEGDYKNPPPPGTYEAELAQSRASLKKPPVHLTLPQRQIAGRAMVERLLEMQIELLALSVGAAHYHLLGRFPNAQVRWPVGRAKKHASHLLTGVGLEGSVWGKKCRALPVKDRAHQLNVFEYICNHAAEGAWVWDFRQGIYWK